MVLYRITLIPLAEELKAAYSGLLSPFYADDVAFNSLVQQSAQLLKLLMKRGPDQGYFPELAKSLFLLEILVQEEASKNDFYVKGLTLKSVSVSRYLGTYLGP